MTVGGPGGGEPPRRPVNLLVVSLGAVLGVLASWALTFAILVNSRMEEGPALVVSVAVPAVLAAVGLVFPAVRQFSAGLVLGVCIGAIVGAGVCGLLWVQLSQL